MEFDQIDNQVSCKSMRIDKDEIGKLQTQQSLMLSETKYIITTNRHTPFVKTIIGFMH